MIDKLDLSAGSRKPLAAIQTSPMNSSDELLSSTIEEKKATVAFELVAKIDEGIQAAAKIARKNNMVRAFAIAPTASCSYRSKDLDGYTCTPEIAPPIGRTVDRDSWYIRCPNL